MKISLPVRVAIAFGAICLVWHVVVATSAKTKLAGPFLAKPGQPGYVWTDMGNTDSRLFWDIADVRWKAGLYHPDYNVRSADKLGDWTPLPGYVFVDQSVDMTTTWAADQLHPDFMAWSDKNEGAWIPVAGYKFLYQDGDISGTAWEPNKRYDDLKIITLTQQDQYKPLPGYQFVEPGKSLKVVWIPGLVNSDNRQLMAGTTEGSWVVANPRNPGYRGYSRSGGNSFGRYLARRAAVRATDNFVDRAFGY